MLTALTVLHIAICLFLILLVLIQDSKGGMGSLGGGGSNSLLGATGAETLFSKMTRWVAVGFMVSCLALSILSGTKPKSVIDDFVAPPAAQEAAEPSEPAAPSEP